MPVIAGALRRNALHRDRLLDTGYIVGPEVCLAAQADVEIPGSGVLGTVLSCISDRERFGDLTEDLGDIAWDGPSRTYVLLADAITFSGAEPVTVAVVDTMDAPGDSFRA